LPEIDDEFAQSLGEFTTFAELRESIAAQLSERNREEYDQKYFDELLS